MTCWGVGVELAMRRLGRRREVGLRFRVGRWSRTGKRCGLVFVGRGAGARSADLIAEDLAWLWRVIQRSDLHWDWERKDRARHDRMRASWRCVRAE